MGFFVFVVVSLTILHLTVATTKLKIEKVVVLSNDKDYLDDFLIEAFKINETASGIRFQYEPKAEINETSSRIKIDVEKFENGQWETVPIEIDQTLYDFIKMDEIGDVLKNFCTPPIVWPIARNVHYKCEHPIPDLEMFGDMAFGEWKLTTTYTINDHVALKMESYALVEND